MPKLPASFGQGLEGPASPRSPRRLLRLVGKALSWGLSFTQAGKVPVLKLSVQCKGDTDCPSSHCHSGLEVGWGPSS